MIMETPIVDEERNVRKRHVPEQWWEHVYTGFGMYEKAMGDCLHPVLPTQQEIDDPVLAAFHVDVAGREPREFTISEEVIRAGRLQECINEIRHVFAWSTDAEFEYYGNSRALEDQLDRVVIKWEEAHTEYGLELPARYYLEIAERKFYLPQLT